MSSSYSRCVGEALVPSSEEGEASSALDRKVGILNKNNKQNYSRNVSESTTDTCVALGADTGQSGQLACSSIPPDNTDLATSRRRKLAWHSTAGSFCAHSIPEVCRLTGLGRTSIYAAIKSGELIARHWRRRTIVLAADLQAFLNNLPKSS
jgi:hypothetical protein